MSPNATLWLASAMVQEGLNRITLPSEVIEMDVARCQQPLHFFIEDGSDRIVISRELLADGGSSADSPTTGVRLDRIDHGTVGENRVVTVPKQFFPDYQGKAMGSQPLTETLQLEYGMRCHFVMTEELFDQRGCYIIPDDRPIREIMKNTSDNLIGDGGTVDPDIPDEGELDDGEVLWMEQDRVLSTETGIKLLKSLSDAENTARWKLDEDYETGNQNEVPPAGSVIPLPMSDIDISSQEVVLSPSESGFTDQDEYDWLHFTKKQYGIRPYCIVLEVDPFMTKENISLTFCFGNGGGGIGIESGQGDNINEALASVVQMDSLIPVRRGCGSPQCQCGNPHTVDTTVFGEANGYHVTIRPAQAGLGIEASPTVETILELAGIEDAFVDEIEPAGERRRVLNLAQATRIALTIDDLPTDVDPSKYKQYLSEDNL